MRFSTLSLMSAGRPAKFSNALGCTPIMRLMMNSRRARPTPSFGNWAKSKARSGLPTFIMILNGRSGMASTEFLRTSKPSSPSKMKPVSPSAQETVTPWPSCRIWVALPQPTTAGMPSSRAMIAAWQVRPPRLVTMALARFITGSQSGSVMSETRTSPGWTLSISDTSLITLTGPAPMRWPMARPSTRTVPFSFSR
ncbi:hypothetical protein PAERUG_P45_London_17_VIM_2_12_12_05373 [Pseudomonas aeruginosa]|nr:hypothetical protein PAERUG_E16_London_17_VIM_2_04_14_05616 [Pseudomonas aeruginosa]CRR80576.1 hypothetical protein PAERUG_P45_London_17_VIM_2_12_12_05373 [Pseudomonas aeruginosa]